MENPKKQVDHFLLEDKVNIKGIATYDENKEIEKDRS